jgi:hypothetical protein
MDPAAFLKSKDPYFGIGLQNDLAKICVMVGEFDQAMPIIEHSLATLAGFSVNQLRFHPLFDPLRGDPRFQRLLQQPDHVFQVAAK